MKMIAALLSIVLVSSSAAHADPLHLGRRDYHANQSVRLAPDFHGRDFFRFSSGERAYWNSGRWLNTYHDGRLAWWWVLGDDWYLYPEPIYPYPTYVAPAVIQQLAPLPTPSGLPPTQSWYFCDSPQGYYPYVASCDGAWRPVPVTPAPFSATPAHHS